MNRYPQIDPSAFDPMQRAMTLLQFLGQQEDRNFQQNQMAAKQAIEQQQLQMEQEKMQQLMPLQVQDLEQRLAVDPQEELKMKMLFGLLTHGTNAMGQLNPMQISAAQQFLGFNPPAQEAPTNPMAQFTTFQR